LKFDDSGNLSLHDTLTGKEDTLIHGDTSQVEQYHEGMFHSGHHDVSHTSDTETTTHETQIDKGLAALHKADVERLSGAHGTVESNTPSVPASNTQEIISVSSEKSLNIGGLDYKETIENGQTIWTHTKENGITIKIFSDKHIEYFDKTGKLLESQPAPSASKAEMLRKQILDLSEKAKNQSDVQPPPRTPEIYTSRPAGYNGTFLGNQIYPYAAGRIPGFSPENYQELTPDKIDFLNHHLDLIGRNPDYLSPNKLIEYIKTYQDNLSHVFTGEHAEGNWKAVKNLSASKILSDRTYANDPEHHPLMVYIHRLIDKTGIKPEGRRFLSRPESVDAYIRRALQAGAKNGQLNELKIKEAK